MLFDVFDNRTIVTGELVALDPIHIGSSAKESLNPIELDSPVLKDAAGNPVIPGSSIKGVVRSQFERVMRSLIPDGNGSCGVFGKENCLTPDDKKRLTPEELYEKSCQTCKLFGGIAVAGKLRFKDASYVSQNGRTCQYEKRIISLLEGTLIPDDYLAFGGKTTRGLGRMKLENTNIETVDRDAIMAKFQEMGMTIGKG